MKSVCSSASLLAPLTSPTTRYSSVTADEAACIQTTRMKAGEKLVSGHPSAAVSARKLTDTGLMELGTTIVRNSNMTKDQRKQIGNQADLALF